MVPLLSPLLVLLFLSALVLSVNLPLPELSMTTLEIIESMGYAVEKHTVQTKDGYILELHRMPKGRGADKKALNNNKPALLVHGLGSSGATFVLNFPNQSLGYLMADSGYDVWLFNVRGSEYSQKHIRLSNTNAQFWDFSLDEMAMFDLPAVIDYILATCGKKDLFYVGYSMGASLAAALLSTFPTYNDKIRMIVYLGPTIFMDHIRGVAKEATRLLLKLRNKLEHMGAEFNQQFLTLTHSGSNTCNGNGARVLCQNLAGLYVGPIADSQLNQTRMPIYEKHVPSGVSARSIIQFSQMITDRGEFRRYDWGERRNLKKYSTAFAPKYDLGLVTAPTYVVYSDGDFLSPAHEAAQIAQTHRNVVGQLQIEPLRFSHFDYMWSTRANDVVFQKVIAVMDSAHAQILQ